MSTARRIVRGIARFVFLLGLLLYVVGPGTRQERNAESTNICVVAIGLYTMFPRPRYARRRHSSNPERAMHWQREK